MDPYEFRKKNILKEGSETISGERISRSTGSPSDCLDAVIKEIGWKGYQTEEERLEQIKTGKVRGRDLQHCKNPAMPTYTSTAAIMQMDEDGR